MNSDSQSEKESRRIFCEWLKENVKLTPSQRKTVEEFESIL